MKKFGIAIAIVSTLVVVLMSAGYVFAQGTTPATPQTPGSGYGYERGMMGGRGMMGANVAAGEGILHDAMIAVYAEKLGISVDDLNARLTKGETMAQIASSKGLTTEQFTALMTDARTQAIDQAVKDGKLTQAQADLMETRGGGMNRGATGNGGMMNGTNGRGAGRGMRGAGTGDPATCPHFTQTNP